MSRCSATVLSLLALGEVCSVARAQDVAPSAQNVAVPGAPPATVPTPVPATTTTTTTPAATTTTTAPSGSTQTTVTTTPGGGTRTTVSPADIPSSGLELGTGDEVKLVVDVPDLKSIDENNTLYCAPAGTLLRISNTTDDGGKNFYVSVEKLPKSATPGFFSSTSTTNAAEAAHCKVSTESAVQPGVQYLVPKAALDKHDYSASGLEYGLLLTPYKFHIADRSLTTSATIGPYVGFHAFTSPGSTVSEVFSVGLGTVEVPGADSSGQPTTDNKLSLSAATGYVVTLTKSGRFQAAFLLGIDWAGRASGYKNNGRPWLGIGFGTNLTK